MIREQIAFIGVEPGEQAAAGGMVDRLGFDKPRWTKPLVRQPDGWLWALIEREGA